MSVDTNTVRRIAKLARIRVTDAELPKLRGELNAILQWIEMLGEVDVSHIEPLTSIVDRKLHLRADERDDAGAKDEQRQALTHQPMTGQDKGRPHQVKLLLHCQRPEMQDGARIDGLGEIIMAAAPEVKIRN